MKKILGINNVGVIQRMDGKYLCWDNDNGRWYVSEDINNAHRVLGNKKLNFERIKSVYQKNTNDMSDLKLVVKQYMYHSDANKSGFIEELPVNCAVLYDYV